MIHIMDHLTDKILTVLESKEGAPLFWDDRHVSTTKNEEFFDFTMQATVPAAEHVSKRNRVIIPDEDGYYREFIISETYQTSKRKEVQTEGSFVEIGKQRVINPVSLTGQTIESAVAWVLDGTDWQPGFMDYAGIRTVNFDDHTNALNALYQLRSLFELEVRFRVEVRGNKVSGRFVDFYKTIGRYRGKEILLGKDLVGVTRREQSSNICTALVGLGPIQTDGSRISVIVEDKDALQRWGRNGKHLFDIYEPETEDDNMTVERLTTLTTTELNKRINASVQYEADAVSIEDIFGREHEKVRLGDTERIKDTSYEPPLYLEAKVISMERSLSDKSQRRFILGDFIEYREEDVMRTFKILKGQIAMKTSNAQMEAFFAENTYTKTEIDSKDSQVKQDIQDGLVPVPTSVLSGAIEVASNKIISADSRFFWDTDGNLYAVNPNAENKVVKFSSEGILLSTNGLVGPYGTAIGADGIVADMITVGTMLFDRLQGGTLTLGGLNNMNGILQLLNSNGEMIADFNSDRGGFADLFVAHLRGNNVVAKTTQDVTYYVSSVESTASDDNNGLSWSTCFRTLSEAIRRIPKHVEHNVTINIGWGSKLYEDVVVSGFFGPGSLTIKGYDHGCILSGHLRVKHNLVDLNFKLFRLESRSAQYNVLSVVNSSVTFENFRIDGNGSTFGYDIGFGGYTRILNCSAYQVSTGIRVGYGAVATVENVDGSCTNTALYAYMGVAMGYGTLPTAPTAILQQYGGEVRGSFTANAGTPPTSPTTTETTQSWNQTASESWRPQFSGQWSGGSTGSDVIQGYWSGYGKYFGLWFFGSAPSTAVTGKTIKQIRVWVQRKSSGGVSGSVPLVFRPHGYSSKPAGQPTMLSAWHTQGFVTGEGKWVTLPSSFHSLFANGSAKGIGIYVDSTGSGDYARMIGTAKLEITYS